MKATRYIVLLSLCVTMVLAYMGTGYSVNERRVEFVIGSKSFLVDGKEFAMDVASFAENDRTYVPVSFLASALNAEVKWKADIQTAEITDKQKQILIKLQPDKKYMFVNGNRVDMDVASVVRNDRMFLPAKYVAQSLNYSVFWRPLTKTILINNDTQDSKADIVKEAYPSKFNIKADVLTYDNKLVNKFSRQEDIFMWGSKNYSDVEGVTTFRGNNYRDSSSYGYADIKEKKLEKLWYKSIGHIDGWTGVGWNGQPSIIRWEDEVKQIMNISPEKKSKPDLKEVIYSTLDGNIYFLDLDDGKETRRPLSVGVPHKGSVAVDPRGYPLLYAGQGIDEVNGKKVNIGYRIFSLIDYKQFMFINGIDYYAKRYWGAFDSVPLIDKNTDSLILFGENGLLYSGKLGTKFDVNKKTISIKPELFKYRYTSNISHKLGTENSPLVYKNLLYAADNSGLIQCIDLNTLKPVWGANGTDDTDSTMVLESFGEDKVDLYTACEVDHQIRTYGYKQGYSYVRKFNALTGKLLWEKSFPCYYDSEVNGGALASPVVGKHDIKDLVIFSIAKTGKYNYGGKLIAFNKETGSVVWQIESPYYSWSSPVDVYTKDGKSYILYCDYLGYMYLIEGKTGKVLDKIELGSTIEGTPAVFGNIAVIGTRGQRIYGIELK